MIGQFCTGKHTGERVNISPPVDIRVVAIFFMYVLAPMLTHLLVCPLSKGSTVGEASGREYKADLIFLFITFLFFLLTFLVMESLCARTCVCVWRIRDWCLYEG